MESRNNRKSLASGYVHQVAADIEILPYKIHKQRTSFQINAYLWKHKLSYIKTPVTILLVLSFPDGVMKLHDIHWDKIKKSTGFRFNVKAVNLFRLIQLYICSMRTICLYVLFLTSVILCAQDKAFWIWPVAEQKAEDGILYRPQDFIGTELNFDNMFVGGKEASPILCPFDAVVNRVSLTFKYNLSQCISRQYLGDQKNGIKLIDANCDKKYINGQIALQSKSGGVLYISGLNFARTFKNRRKAYAW